MYSGSMHATTKHPRASLCGVEFSTKRIAKSKVLAILRSGRARAVWNSYDGFTQEYELAGEKLADVLADEFRRGLHHTIHFIRGALRVASHTGGWTISEVS